MVNIDKHAIFLYNEMSKEMNSFYFWHFLMWKCIAYHNRKGDSIMSLIKGIIAGAGGGTGSAGLTGNNNWSMETFLQNLGDKAKQWGSYFIVFLGIVMIIVSAWQIGTGLMSHGKKQTNWFVAIFLLILGGAFAVGGFGLLATIASGGQQTILDLGSMLLIR